MNKTPLIKFQYHFNQLIVNYKIVPLLVVYYLSATFSYAQAGLYTDSLQAENLYKKSRFFFNKGQYDSSAYFAKQASKAFEKTGNWEKSLFCKNTLGYCMTYSRDLEGAAHLFRQNIDLGLEKLGQNNSEYIMTYSHLSHALKKMGLLDSALYYSKRAVMLAENNPLMDSTQFARVYLAAANTQVAKFYLDSAQATIQKGLRIKNHQQDSIDSYTQELHNTLAIVYYYKNNFGKAIKHYRRALKIATDLTPDNLSYPARYLSNIGLCYMISRNLDSASYLFEKSLQLRIELFGPESLQASRIYESLGFINHERGAYESASSYYQKAHVVYQKILQEKHPRIASSLASLAFVYRDKKNYDLAASHLRKAIDLTTHNFGQVNRLASNYKDLGHIFMKAGKLADAKKELDHAVQIILSQEHIDSVALADTQTYIAELESGLGNDSLANILLSNNLKIYKKKFGRKDFNVASMYIEMGNLKVKSKQYDDALVLFQKSLQSITNSFEDNDISKNPTSYDDIINEGTLLLAIKAKATALHKKYERDRDPSLLKSCLATCELGITLVEQTRNGFIDEESKLNVIKNASGLHELGILSGYTLYNTHKDNSYLNRTFALSEKNKSSILRNTIFESQARSFSDIPDSLLERDNDLRAEISFLDSEIKENENRRRTAHLAVEELEIKRFDLQREHELLIEQFEQDYPKYFELKYNNELATVEEIQSLLSDDTNLVEYHVGDSSIYIWVLNHTGLSVERVTIDRSTFVSSTEDFKHAIIKQDLSEYSAQAQKLYDWLIRPVSSLLIGNRLIIVPDDHIWEINFELLLRNKPSSINYQDFDYLLKKFAISYAYSANLLYSQAKGKHAKKTKAEILAFSFGNGHESGDNIALSTMRNSQLEDLPGSRKEIHQISEIFDGNYFFGEQASEATFKALAGDYAILHLALHGESNANHPNSSNLSFTSEADSIDDGHLYAYELYNLTLPADLAVLSACNTGMGQLISGEGMMTLGRAFTYAGCKSLLYTQWEIPDKSTPTLMKYFYEGLRDGKPKDIALKDAKLAFLMQSGPAETSPLFWGGFVLQGVSDPFNEANNTLTLLLAIGSLLLIGAVGFRFFK